MTKLTKASEAINKEYSNIFNQIYNSNELSNPADINIYNRMKDSGYISNQNTIEINLVDHDLEELLTDESDKNAPLSKRFDLWPTWFSDLFEEMVHEFEDKIINDKLSSNGELLATEYYRYVDENHGKSFFTAISEVAGRLSINAESLLFHLGRIR